MNGNSFALKTTYKNSLQAEIFHEAVVCRLLI